MKKQLLIIGTILMLTSASIHAQYSSWSIQAKGGVNSMKGGDDGSGKSINPAFGAALEYTLNPVVGFGAEYYYMDNKQAGLSFNSKVSQALLFTSFNMSNLTMRYRKGFWSKTNIYVNLGGGLGFGDWKGTGLSAAKSGDVVNLAYSFGSNVEYNINRSLAIGVEADYRWFSNSKFNMPPFEEFHKGFYNVNFAVRYKIPCKARTHIRNVSVVAYDITNTSNNTEKIDGLQTQIDSLKQAVAVIAAEPKQITQYIMSNDTARKPAANAAVQSATPFDSTRMLNGTRRAVVLPVEAEEPASTIGDVQMKTESYVNSQLKRYSVVVGSFMNKENADAMISNLKGQGISAETVQNEQGKYRVVVFGSNSLGAAISQAKKMRSRYPGAWVLILK